MIFETKMLNRFMGAIQIPLPKGTETALEKLQGHVASGKTLLVEIKLKKARRSLTANSAMWAMLRDMAAVLKTTDQELYLLALQKYGVSDYIACTPEAVPRVSRLYRLVIDRGPCYVNGNRLTCLQVFPGSSTYDTKQFSVLLDGVIQDAKEQGVNFVSEADKALLLEERGISNDSSRVD